MSLESTYPPSVFCIIASEFCERLSFCGLRTILSIYLRNELLFSEDTATVIYHVFIMLCFIVPLVGAICADSFLGRYRTILYFSLIYFLGNILMCIGSIPTIETSTIALSTAGLFLVAVGSGGVKPCMAAFGGDQFRLPAQKDLLQPFFSTFYFAINLGGFVGMVITPILRKWVTCFGQDTCYLLGFGFPALLTLLSLLVFIMGKTWYRLKVPKKNVILEFFRCILYALKNEDIRKIRKSTNPCAWLDVSKREFGAKMVHDVKIVLACLLLYVPVPIFWSLFDQQGSRWTFQASHMNGKFFGLEIVPDQMQVVNPVMVLLMIPVFDNFLTPLFAKIHLMDNCLHKMAIGGLFASLAFLSAGVLELVLDHESPPQPEKNYSALEIINSLPCGVQIYNPVKGSRFISSGKSVKWENLACRNTTKFTVSVEVENCGGGFQEAKQNRDFELTIREQQSNSVLIGFDNLDRLQAFISEPLDFQKSLSGNPRLRISCAKNSPKITNLSVSLQNHFLGLQDIYYVPDLELAWMSDSAYMELPQGIYDVVIRSNQVALLYENTMHMDMGGVYSLMIWEQKGRVQFFRMYVISRPTDISMLWLLPQYFLISVAEILFGIAGLEFSYTQAPKSMKTITIAGWYLTVAVGNFLVIIVTQANFFGTQAEEFFLFGIIMVADMVLFMEMASKYKFVPLEADSSSSFFQAGAETPLIPVAQ